MEHEQGVVPGGYQALLGELKERIRSAQIRTALSVNRELILLYWQIGKSIQERQETHGWGAQVIRRLSHDLHQAFPEMKGFSPRNLQYMRTFAGAYTDPEIAQQLLRDLPWGHPDDQSSLGLILCKAQNKIVAEYALRDMSKPIGVSAYQLTAVLPEQLRGRLPTIEELEATLSDLEAEQ